MANMIEDTPPRYDVFDRDCPGRGVMDHVVSRWGVLVLGVLLERGTLRFSELRRAVGGVSEKMLAQTLQAQERDGLVHREVRPVIPPHVEYRLTPLGEPLARQVRGLYELIEGSVPAVLEARRAYDERKAARAG